MGVEIKISKNYLGEVIGSFKIKFDDLVPDDIFTEYGLHISDFDKIEMIKETILNVFEVKEK